MAREKPYKPRKRAYKPPKARFIEPSWAEPAWSKELSKRKKKW